MINTLAVASNGYLTPYTIRTLEVSVDGYLIETIVPIHRDNGNDTGKSEYNASAATASEAERRRRIIKNEENDILTVLQIWIKCV